MKHCFNGRTKHATTALVLVAWLFALASGIANACLLEEPRANHSHAAAMEDVPHPHGVADPSHVIKTLCLDACDERTNTLPKQRASINPPTPAPLALFTIVWRESQPGASAPRLRRDKHADPFGIPIRSRFSRLTL